LKAYFSKIRSQLKHTRSQITSNLFASNWKSSYYVNDVMLVGAKVVNNISRLHMRWTCCLKGDELHYKCLCCTPACFTSQKNSVKHSNCLITFDSKKCIRFNDYCLEVLIAKLKDYLSYWFSLWVFSITWRPSSVIIKFFTF
jgi:hypothetical protein